MAEASLYPVVERFLRDQLGCFATRQQVGLAQNRIQGTIDVVGIRHIGGDLRGDIEIIACEVKDGEPFLKSAGQARAYGVMAHRCYLASEYDYNHDQRRVAEHLSIGLVCISGDERKRFTEIQSAPLVTPVTSYIDELVEKRFGYGRCTVCSSLFKISDAPNRALMQTEHVTRSSTRRSIRDARARGSGFAYWLSHQQTIRTDERTETRLENGDAIFDRRYVCADCIEAFDLRFDIIEPKLTLTSK